MYHRDIERRFIEDNKDSIICEPSGRTLTELEDDVKRSKQLVVQF